MWLVADYEASALFSLKPATATASGGKTLLAPTPFAIKMALLDAACRLEGRDRAAQAWDGWLAGLTVALRPARDVVVNNTFIKIWKPWEFKGKKKDRALAIQKAREKRKYPLQDTISYREYVHWAGTLGIGLELTEQADADRLAWWLLHINYLGKRGSFVQAVKWPQAVDELPDGYIVVNGNLAGMSLDAVLTQLDDVGEGLTFARADVFSEKTISLGKHRVLRHVALPYRLVASSRGYSHYRLIEEDR